MTFELVVARPFGGLLRGDRIRDPKRIAEILGSEHATWVVRVAATGKED